MSGPARGRLQSVPRPAARAGAAARPSVARPRMQAAAGTVALPQGQPLGARLADAVASLPDARWLDRLLRGRAWIFLIAVGLFGLVFMQVSMLGMNAGIGQAVEKSTVLERQNADMRAQVSQLSSEDRIQREALAAGLVLPPAGDVRYLRSNGLRADAARAGKVMRAPSEQAKATAAAAASGAAAVGTPAGTTAPTGVDTGVAGATTPAGETAAATSGAATSGTPAAAAEQAPAAAATQQQAPAAATQQQAPATTQQPAPATTQQAPATTQQGQTQQQAPVQQSAPATAAGAAVAPGNG